MTGERKNECEGVRTERIAFECESSRDDDHANTRKEKTVRVRHDLGDPLDGGAQRLCAETRWAV